MAVFSPRVWQREALKANRADLDALAQLARDASERSGFSADHHRTARHAEQCILELLEAPPDDRAAAEGQLAEVVQAIESLLADTGDAEPPALQKVNELRRQLRQSRARRSSLQAVVAPPREAPALADGGFGGHADDAGFDEGQAARRLREEELLKSNASAAAWGTQFRSFVHELEGLLREMDVPKDGVAQVRATVQRVLDDRDEYNGGTAKPQLVARIAASHALADAPEQK